MKTLQIHPVLTFPKADLSPPPTFTNRKITGFHAENLLSHPIYAQVKSKVINIFRQLNLCDRILAY